MSAASRASSVGSMAVSAESRDGGATLTSTGPARRGAARRSDASRPTLAGHAGRLHPGPSAPRSAGRVRAVERRRHRSSTRAEPRRSTRRWRPTSDSSWSRPDPSGTARSRRSTTRACSRFLETAWAEYQAAFGPTREVVPDVFFHDRLRAGMARRPPSPSTSAAGSGGGATRRRRRWSSRHLRRGPQRRSMSPSPHRAGARRRSRRLRPVPAARAPRLPRLYGGYCFFNNAAIAAHHLVGARPAARSPSSTSTTTTATAASRSSTTATTSSTSRSTAIPPGPTRTSSGFADETGTGRGRGTTCNFPLAPTHRRRRLPRCARPGPRPDRRLRPRGCRGVARARHLRHRPDLRPRPHHRRVRTLRRRGRRAWSADRRGPGGRLRRRCARRERRRAGGFVRSGG